MVRSVLRKIGWVFLLLLVWNGGAPLVGQVSDAASPRTSASGAESTEKTLTPRERRARRNIVIFLDPGHGGEDYGCYSKTKPKTYEKFLALSTAYMVRERLTKMGYKVYLSRYSDEYPELLERVDAAQRRRANLYVSLHYNSAPSVDAHGIEVFYFDTKRPGVRTKESRKMARSVLSGIVGVTGARSRGVKHGNFAVIRETSMPAILVEGGFLTNSEELKSLKNQNYLSDLSKGVAVGVDNYVQQTMLKKKAR